MKYDVIIIGAGAAGYGCALTLGSANDKFDWAKNRKYLMLDSKKSDLNVGRYFNVAGVESGINGVDLLIKLENQLKNYPSVELKNDEVIEIKEIENGFLIVCNSISYEAEIVVLATGLHKFDIKCEYVKVLDNIFVPKPNNIYLEHKNNIIAPNLYVAGLASGVPTMFSCASGDGAKVACDIFKKYAGKIAVVHDVKA